jgi:sugar transferase (PEP-CTERM/EpsH1 system associated)
MSGLVETATKEPLLFLCHRIPFPPNKGDKIRAFHLLKFLAQHFDVHLGTFVDDPDDWAYQNALNEWCVSTKLIGIDPKRAKVKSLKGMFTGQPLTLPFYESSELQSWVDDYVDRFAIKKVVAFSAAMAQFLESQRCVSQLTKRVIDIVDIDSDKWQQYSEQKTWPMSWVYRREARTLFQYEVKVATLMDQSYFVSSTEASDFIDRAPNTAKKVSFYNNGVDHHFFAPNQGYANPYTSADALRFVFTGAMDYWPNVDAVVWFAQSVFPGIKAKFPEAEFVIVGGKPTEDVLNLGKLTGVTVTGRVEDVRPYIEYASAVVAPMRIARGIQNKVLEGMAMSKPVLVTQKGLDGIPALHNQHVYVANDESAFIDAANLVASGQLAILQKPARDLVQEQFDWDHTLPVVLTALDMESEHV